ncbi:MAG: hypothetical protein H6606_00175 [Flavobacteriales bacterium]|nr:hypothetical protein [Flavobacteriales bacterium]
MSALRTYRICFLLSAFVLTNLTVSAQSDTLEEQTVSHAVQKRVEKDRVILRWAPANYGLFRHGIENGYRLERRAFRVNPEVDLSPETDLDKSFKVLADVKPWSEELWRANARDSSDIYAGVAMQILLSPELNTDGQSDMESLKSLYEDQQRRFAYALLAADLSATAALGLGLRYEDKDVKPGHYYEYRITFNSLPEEFVQDTVLTFADMTLPYVRKAVDHCFLEAGDKQITVYWTRHNDQFFTAYDVERSSDKLNWERLNKRPWITSLFTPGTPNFLIDSLDNNEKTYHYRIRGYTAFGDRGAYSEIMTAQGKDLTPPAPPWGVKAEDMGGYVAITWDAQPLEPDFDGFYVERSDAPNGYFERISEKLPAQAREFADLLPAPLESNYYRVSSVDRNGNEAPSFSDLGYLVDSMPPSKPEGLKGSIDTNGLVSLQWAPGPEADIIGYRVYWSNDPHTEFTQLTGDVVPGINFTDSVKIRTLNEEIYYRIVAVDHRYNHSVLSETLTLRKPDLVAPAPALLHEYGAFDRGIELRWYVSSSTDVVKQTLMRESGGVRSALQSWNNNTTNSYTDGAIEKNTTYAYSIVSEDDAGNRSESDLLRITSPDLMLRKTDIKAVYSIEGNGARISWNPTAENSKILIYRTREDETVKLGTSREKSWLDPEYKPGDRYTIRVIYSEGSESPLIEVSTN